jgi:hypothetical protein
MAIEKRWPSVGPLPLVLQGTTDGKIYLSDVTGFHVKQKIQLTDPYIPGELALQVKRVVGVLSLDFSDYPYLEVGPPDAALTARTDVSAYGVTSQVFAPEQPRPSIPLQELDRATYNDEPAVAKRTVRVDPQGNYIDANNPAATALFGTQITILNNLLTMQIQAAQSPPVIEPSGMIINNEGFFIFDNEGNFIPFG